jgi:nicotinamidase-related amidase
MKNIALLVIDIQNALVMLEPYDFENVISNIKTLITAFRQFHEEIIYIRHTEEDGSDFKLQSDGWELYKDLVPEDNELVINKYYNSAFRQTNLQSYLRSKQIETLVIVGMQTEYCFDTTCKVAFELGYDVIIPEKTNTTFDNDLLSAKQIYTHYNYYVLNNNFAKVLSIENVIHLIKQENI